MLLYGFISYVEAGFLDARDFNPERFTIILPDENLKFPWDEGCDPVFKKQIESNEGRD